MKKDYYLSQEEFEKLYKKASIVYYTSSVTAHYCSSFDCDGYIDIIPVMQYLKHEADILFNEMILIKDKFES